MVLDCRTCCLWIRSCSLDFVGHRKEAETGEKQPYYTPGMSCTSFEIMISRKRIELQRQIKIMEYILQHDPNDILRKIHRKALKNLKKELEALEHMEV